MNTIKLDGLAPVITDPFKHVTYGGRKKFSKNVISLVPMQINTS